MRGGRREFKGGCVVVWRDGFIVRGLLLWPGEVLLRLVLEGCGGIVWFGFVTGCGAWRR